MGSRRTRDAAGYVAILTALFFSSLFLGLCAIGVDLSREYLEAQRIQKVADAAVLAGVTYMPQDFTRASAKANAVAQSNGYSAGSTISVTVSRATKTNQLRVTVTSRITNTFGQLFGVRTASITRSALAEYTGPAPVGSPCITFGNEPPSQPSRSTQDPYPVGQPEGSALASSNNFDGCSTRPNYWAAVEGPETDKVQGDRYGTTGCASTTTFGCASGTSGNNTEYRNSGYFFSVHIEPNAVGQQVQVQAYDPAFVFTGPSCSTYTAGIVNDMNPWTSTDGQSRYNSGNTNYCSRGYYPGGSSGTPATTTFVVRQPISTADPTQAPIVSSSCVKQFVGFSQNYSVNSSGAYVSGSTYAGPAPVQLNSTNSNYNAQVSRIYHQWVPLCTFIPTATGDYYIQVRTNVSTSGGTADTIGGSSSTPLVFTGNPAASAADGNTTAGSGLNAFALRAYIVSDSLRKSVSVAAFQNLPILQNSPSTTANFYLIRALPTTKGGNINFSFFDAADGTTSDTGYIQVLPPPDATGTLASGKIPGCKAGLNSNATSTDLTDCKAPVKKSVNNGQLENLSIPIPGDYNCDESTLGGCWFRVQVHFDGSVTDFTTWDASIAGDPVRLVE